MSAFTNLITFAAKLDGKLLTEYQQLINAYMDEKYNLQNERIATSQANTGTFEVVAIAGTSETLLTNPHQTIEGC
jgi:DNA/RNA endonuclease YhcR with UshA esterase domain